MKRHALFIALAAVGLAATAPAFAQSSRDKEIKALKALVEKQQQQLNQQQQDLQQLHEALSQLQNQQTQQQTQIQQTQQAQAQVQTTVAAAQKQAPTFSSAPGVAVTLHGFIDATAFSQSKSFTFGNGQNAEYPIPGTRGTLSGVDVRNTRFWLDFSGAKVAGDWVGGGHLEMDFFGGNNGTGPYSQEQPLPRLRQAYMVLENPLTGSSFKIGQMWDLMFPLDDLPNSLSHIAFPLGYGTGIIGWRFPGIVFSQDLNHGSTGPQWRLDVGAFEGTWNGPGSPVNYLSAGNAGFRPQIEARLHVEQPKQWLLFAAAHWSQINLAGVGGTEATPVKRQFASEAFEVGGQWTPGQWVLRSVAYTGRGIGQLFGDLSQFGDIKDTGAYVMGGYKFTPNWSANVFYAFSKPNSNDVVRWFNHGATGLLKDRQVAANVQYSVGDYSFALEWIHAILNSTSNGVNRVTTSGNQVNVSAFYKF
jgi:primosomal replication protein N